MKLRALPRQAQLLVLLLGLAGAAIVVASLPAAGDWGREDALTWAVFAGAVVVVEQFWIEIRHGTERENFSLTDAVFAAGLLLVAPTTLFLAVAAGAVAGQAVRRVAPFKIAFNVGQFLVALAAAELVFSQIGEREAASVASWIAAAAAMSVYFVLNMSSVALVLSLVDPEDSFRNLVRSSLGLSVLHFAGNLALGFLAAVVWDTAPAALPLLSVPLVLSYLAYRGWLRGTLVRDRMIEMRQIADVIADDGDMARRIEVEDSHDEVELLARTFNRMLESVEAAFARERQFMDEASHELRTPVTICRGYLEVLQPGASADDVRATVEVVVDELARMGRILDDLETLARAEHPRFLRPETVSIRRLQLDLAAKAAPLLDGRLQLDAVGDDETLRADPQRLVQALIGLVHNAAVHGDGSVGGVELRIVRENGAWRFEVSDRGPGVAEGDEEKVFEPFYRSDAQTPGRGLGLAIVRAIAEAHRGTTGVVNRDGGGAIFWIRLPA